MTNSHPVIGIDGAIYITGEPEDEDYAEYLYAMNGDGTVRWKRLFAAPVSNPAVGDDGTLYLGCDDHKIYALNPDGSDNWIYDVGASYCATMADPVLWPGGKLYYLDRALGRVNALNAAGSPAWSYQLPDSAGGANAAGQDGAICVACADGRVYMIDAGGVLRWSYYVAGRAGVSLDAAGTVYASSGDGRLYALDADGTLKWWFVSPSSFTAAPVIGEDGTIYAGNCTGSIYAVGPGSQLTEHSVTGYVKDGTGTGIAGVVISITGEEPAVTGTDGRWTAGALTPGTYIAAATKEGWEFSPVLLPFNVGDSDLVLGEFTANPSAGVPEWPMWGGNRAHTRRSSHAGPPAASTLWSVWLAGNSFLEEPAIGGDGALYFNSGCGGLYALNRDGTLRWGLEDFLGGGSTPALAVDDTLYAMSSDGNACRLRAFTPGGAFKWSFATGIGALPVLNADGTLLLNTGDLVAFDSSGMLAWAYPADWLSNGAAIDTHDVIYTYQSLDEITVTCTLNPDGSLVRNIPIESSGGNSQFQSIAVGDDGTVYRLNGSYINTLAQDGSLKWLYELAGDGALPPAIGADGSIYICMQDNLPENNKVIALNPDGALRWEFKHAEDYDFDSAPVLDGNGVLYVALRRLGDMYAFYPDGTVKWIFNSPANCSAPAIGADGTLYFGDDVGHVYALGPGGG